MLVSFYILAYNHENMIADAIKAALAQTYSPLQIIISDDCSTDSTWEVINRTITSYTGPHDLIIRRNVKNLGIAAHINALWQKCEGDWIIASAGDDTSLPKRVEIIMDAIRINKNVKLVQSWLNEVDENNNLLTINELGVKAVDADPIFFSIQERLVGASYAPHGAAMAYAREIFSAFDPIPEDVIFEDNIINFRAELLGVAMVLPVSLVNHKNHLGQITRNHGSIPSRIREIRRVRRLVSDISTSRQNLQDLGRVFNFSKEDKKALERLCMKEFAEARLRKSAIIGLWPFKLLSLCRLFLMNSMRALSNDDLMRAILPYFVYRSAKNFRN
jgi:glycosyltransferase involved in cell wall biosynthesis